MEKTAESSRNIWIANWFKNEIYGLNTIGEEQPLTTYEILRLSSLVDYLLKNEDISGKVFIYCDIWTRRYIKKLANKENKIDKSEPFYQLLKEKDFDFLSKLEENTLDKYYQSTEPFDYNLFQETKKQLAIIRGLRDEKNPIKPFSY